MSPSGYNFMKNDPVLIALNTLAEHYKNCAIHSLIVAKIEDRLQSHHGIDIRKYPEY